MRIASSSKHHPLHTRRRQVRLPFGTQYFLAAFEGIEGGFAIGTSVIIALSFVYHDRDILLIAALIAIIVNGFNNASVKYSSEHYLDELDGREKHSPFRYYFMPAGIEFAASITIGLLAIVPIVVIESKDLAIGLAIGLTLVILFAAGYWRAYMLRMPRLRDAIETAGLGGGIMLVGALSGWLISLL